MPKKLTGVAYTAPSESSDQIVKLINDQIKFDRRKKIEEVVWKICKSVLIAAGAAIGTTVLQFLELRLAETHPMLMQGLLSVAIAGLKAAIGVINKL